MADQAMINAIFALPSDDESDDDEPAPTRMVVQREKTPEIKVEPKVEPCSQFRIRSPQETVRHRLTALETGYCLPEYKHELPARRKQSDVVKSHADFIIQILEDIGKRLKEKECTKESELPAFLRAFEEIAIDQMRDAKCEVVLKLLGRDLYIMAGMMIGLLRGDEDYRYGRGTPFQYGKEFVIRNFYVEAEAFLLKETVQKTDQDLTRKRKAEEEAESEKREREREQRIRDEEAQEAERDREYCAYVDRSYFSQELFLQLVAGEGKTEEEAHAICMARATQQRIADQEARDRVAVSSPPRSVVDPDEVREIELVEDELAGLSVRNEPTNAEIYALVARTGAISFREYDPSTVKMEVDEEEEEEDLDGVPIPDEPEEAASDDEEDPAHQWMYSGDEAREDHVRPAVTDEQIAAASRAINRGRNHARTSADAGIAEEIAEYERHLESSGQQNGAAQPVDAREEREEEEDPATKEAKRAERYEKLLQLQRLYGEKFGESSQQPQQQQQQPPVHAALAAQPPDARAANGHQYRRVDEAAPRSFVQPREPGGRRPEYGESWRQPPRESRGEHSGHISSSYNQRPVAAFAGVSHQQPPTHPPREPIDGPSSPNYGSFSPDYSPCSPAYADADHEADRAHQAVRNGGERSDDHGAAQHTAARAAHAAREQQAAAAAAAAQREMEQRGRRRERDHVPHHLQHHHHHHMDPRVQHMQQRQQPHQQDPHMQPSQQMHQHQQHLQQPCHQDPRMQPSQQLLQQMQHGRPRTRSQEQREREKREREMAKRQPLLHTPLPPPPPPPQPRMTRSASREAHEQRVAMLHHPDTIRNASREAHEQRVAMLHHPDTIRSGTVVDSHGARVPLLPSPVLTRSASRERMLAEQRHREAQRAQMTSPPMPLHLDMTHSGSREAHVPPPAPSPVLTRCASRERETFEQQRWEAAEDARLQQLQQEARLHRPRTRSLERHALRAPPPQQQQQPLDRMAAHSASRERDPTPMRGAHFAPLGSYVNVPWEREAVATRRDEPMEEDVQWIAPDLYAHLEPYKQRLTQVEMQKMREAREWEEKRKMQEAKEKPKISGCGMQGLMDKGLVRLETFPGAPVIDRKPPRVNFGVRPKPQDRLKRALRTKGIGKVAPVLLTDMHADKIRFTDDAKGRKQREALVNLQRLHAEFPKKKVQFADETDERHQIRCYSMQARQRPLAKSKLMPSDKTDDGYDRFYVDKQLCWQQQLLAHTKATFERGPFWWDTATLEGRHVTGSVSFEGWWKHHQVKHNPFFFASLAVTVTRRQDAIYTQASALRVRGQRNFAEFEVPHRNYKIIAAIKPMEDRLIDSKWLPQLRLFVSSAFGYELNREIGPKSPANSGCSYLIMADSLLDRVNTYRFPQAHFVIHQKPLTLSSSFHVLCNEIELEKLLNIEYFVFAYGFDEIVFWGEHPAIVAETVVQHCLATMHLCTMARELLHNTHRCMVNQKFRVFKLPYKKMDKKILPWIEQFNRALDAVVESFKDGLEQNGTEEMNPLWELMFKVVDWETPEIVATTNANGNRENFERNLADSYEYNCIDSFAVSMWKNLQMRTNRRLPDANAEHTEFQERRVKCSGLSDKEWKKVIV